MSCSQRDEATPRARIAARAGEPGERDLRRLEVEVARPRPELERLGCLELDTSKTRKRLLREYLSVGSAFEEDRGIVEERLRDLAEVA